VAAEFRELPGLRVIVERAVYMPNLEAPPERPHPFVYFIRIRNDSTKTVLIRGRKWILKDDNGQIFVVEGRGVVGQMPEIRPEESFTYNSYHVISKNSVVSGSFFGVAEDGMSLRVRIPEFRLEVPETG
jgi:ApaG protein